MATNTLQLESQVGPLSPKADGTIIGYPRAGKTGESVSGAAHAPHFEAASRGKVYMACNQAAVTFGTALTTTGVTFHLCNPIGSLVDLVVLQTSLSIITCTTAGSIVYANSRHSTTDVTAGTALSVFNGKLFGSAGYGLAKSATTLPATPTACRVLATGFFVGTTPAIVFGGPMIDYVDGAIVVEPGCQLSVQGITVVGTGLIGMCWEEVLR